MNHQIRNIYRSIEDLTSQMDYLRDLISLRGYNPYNYTDNPYDYTTYNTLNPNYNFEHTSPTTNPIFPMPPFTSTSNTSTNT